MLASAGSGQTELRLENYLLIPHDAIAENMSITGFAAQFAVS
jgi:hypothetical protein